MLVEMCRLFLQATCLAFIVIAVKAQDENMQACVDLVDIENAKLKCCDTLQRMSEHCDACHSAGSECEVSNCFLEKIGFLGDDKKVSEEKSASVISEWLVDYPDEKPMLERIKKQCLNGKYTEYTQFPDACDSTRLHICTYVNAMAECPKWKNTDQCMKIQDMAKKCTIALDHMKR